MPKVQKCAFCGDEFSQGTGIMFVRSDGVILWFCSSKCRKNAVKLKRDSRKLKWTKFYQKEEKTKIR
ncbi:50S ribosomal protein L24e [Candidatus Bathyarchaeota archaeon]|nr:50S ribosomal protein L24e [Candidatus Bathyarchaeota archaeon]